MGCISLFPDGTILSFFQIIEFPTLLQAVWLKAGRGETLWVARVGPTGTGCL